MRMSSIYLSYLASTSACMSPIDFKSTSEIALPSLKALTWLCTTDRSLLKSPSSVFKSSDTSLIFLCCYSAFALTSLIFSCVKAVSRLLMAAFALSRSRAIRSSTKGAISVLIFSYAFWSGMFMSWLPSWLMASHIFLLSLLWIMSRAEISNLISSCSVKPSVWNNSSWTIFTPRVIFSLSPDWISLVRPNAEICCSSEMLR